MALHVLIRQKVSKEAPMVQATAHPDHRLISSEDVQGTDVYGVGDEAIGEIDHLFVCGHELWWLPRIGT
jgi:hypothetical protein